MAVLTEEERQKVWRGFMRYLSRQDINDTVLNCVKQDIKDAVDDTDDYIDANDVNYNNSLPATFKANAKSGQKALLFCAVALIRYDEQLLRQLLGELD